MNRKSAAWREFLTGASASQVKYALGMGTAALISYVLAHTLHLAGSYWSVLSAVIVYRFDFGNTLGASRDRMLGTAAGAALAVAFLALARLWRVPDILLLAGVILPLCFLSALRPPYRAGLVTSIIVLSAGGAEATPLGAAVGRVLAVGLGAFIGGLFSFFLSLTKHPGTGHDPAARVILGLGSLLLLTPRPDDSGRKARVQRDLYSGLNRFSSAARESLPEATPIVKFLTLVYWDIVFIDRVAPTTLELEDKPGLQAALGQLALSFQHLCEQTAESLRQGKPLPTLIDFDEACSRLTDSRIDNHIPRGMEEMAIFSLLRLLRQDFKSLLNTLSFENP